MVGLVLTGGVIITFSLSHSSFEQYLNNWQQTHAIAGSSTSTESTELSTPTFGNSWPLIIVWGVVGLVTYAVAASVVRFILQTIAFSKEMDFIHANPRSMIKVTIEHMAMRLVAAALLVALALFFTNQILPYAITASRTSASDVGTFTGLGYAILSFLLTTICTYAGMVLLRLSFGKARLVSIRY